MSWGILENRKYILVGFFTSLGESRTRWMLCVKLLILYWILELMCECPLFIIIEYEFFIVLINYFQIVLITFSVRDAKTLIQNIKRVKVQEIKMNCKDINNEWMTGGEFCMKSMYYFLHSQE